MEDTSYARIHLQPRLQASEHQPLLDKTPASAKRLFAVRGWYMIGSFQLCGTYYAMNMLLNAGTIIHFDMMLGLAAWPLVVGVGYRVMQEGHQFPDRPTPSSPPTQTKLEWPIAFRKSAKGLALRVLGTLFFVGLACMLAWGGEWDWERGGHAGLVFVQAAATVDVALGISILAWLRQSVREIMRDQPVE